MADFEEITFYGIDGDEAENFIRTIRKRAHMEGKQRDDEWIADFAAMCFSGNALRWYETLDDDVQRDWSKLRRAILDWLPDTGSRSVVPSVSAYGASSQAAPPPTPAPAPFPLSPTSTTAFPQESMVPLLEGVFQVTSVTGEPMGYLSRTIDSDETLPRTMSLYSALRVRFALFPDRQTIKILDSPGSEQFLGLTWRNLGPSDWNRSDTYTAAIVPVSFVPSEGRWKSTNRQDKAATQHHIWTLSRDRAAQACFTDISGGIHRLQSVASKGERIRFVLDVDKFIKKDPNYTQVRLVFVSDN